MEFMLPGLVPGDKPIQIIAIRAVGAKFVLVEQALDSAAQTDLVGVILSAHWPTHLAVPTTSQDYHSGTR